MPLTHPRHRGDAPRRLPVATAAALALMLTACAGTPEATAPATGAPAAAAPSAPASPTAPAATAAPAAAAPTGATASPVAPRPPAAAASGSAGARPAGPPAAAATPGAPPAFDTVIKDARKMDGALPVWQKDEKVWIELAPADFGRLFLLSPKTLSGLGESRIFGGLMSGRGQAVTFRKVHNQVQLINPNLSYTAPAGSPESHAVAAAFSPSLLASTPVASAPHPQRQSVLVDATALFVGDLPGLAGQLQRTYRQGYAFDARNSALLRVRGKAGLTVFEVQNHYATASIAVPQPGGAPGAPAPTVPATLSDPRSLFLKMHYSLAPLPAQPMARRPADPRVGYFTTNLTDFGDDRARSPVQRYVNRWRLEKKDPSAALSEPVKPITFWLDRNIPEKYRAPITAGILEWNKAFERIGFKNAVVVKQQAADADWDTLDLDTASIRWMTNAQPSFGAVGPSHVDPRTGEILDADIGFESLSSRSLRALRAQVIGPAVGAAARPLALTGWLELMQARDGQAQLVREGLVGETASPTAHAHDAACDHADFAAEQLGLALDVLAARGDVEPGSPEADQFVADYLMDTTMHEVGHTLGLRHNFRSSKIYTDGQLSDPVFTRRYGLAGSVMEYAPVNLARPGQPGGTAFQLALGPYDYWAIEYAYKPIAPAEEPAELARIAGRSAEPQLAYATDEDNILGLDPESLQFDLGDDVMAFAAKRLDIARDLLKRQDGRTLKPTEDWSLLRRSVSYALRDVGRAAGVLVRQVGGLRTLRDFPGSGRDPLQPLPAAQQRAALTMLIDGLLSPQGLSVSPALQRRLAPDFMERGDALFTGGTMVATDFSPQQMLGEMQRALLTQLLSDGLATRLMDNAAKLEPGADRLALPEVHRRLEQALWKDLGGDIAPERRELQREHVNRLGALLLRPGAMSRADARALVRQNAQALLKRLDAARGKGDEATRAHVADAADSLREALQARVQRAGL